MLMITYSIAFMIYHLIFVFICNFYLFSASLINYSDVAANFFRTLSALSVNKITRALTNVH